MKQTVVVNVKVTNLRPVYNNLKEWCKDCNNNIYIGRKGVVFIDGERYPKESSIWANPYKISKDMSREDCIIEYEKYIRKKIIDEKLVTNLIEIASQNRFDDSPLVMKQKIRKALKARIRAEK